MPLLATETPRKLFFLLKLQLLCARPCPELFLPDRRENAALASVKRPQGSPQLRGPRPSRGLMDVWGVVRTGPRAPTLRQQPCRTNWRRGEGAGGAGTPQVSPRQRGAELRGYAVPAPLSRNQHGRCGGGRGSSDSRQERGGAAIRGASAQARPLGAPDGGAKVRAPPGRLRPAGAGGRAPASEPRSFEGGGGKSSNGGRGKWGGGRLEARSPAPSAIAAPQCRPFLYSLPPSPAFRS